MQVLTEGFGVLVAGLAIRSLHKRLHAMIASVAVSATGTKHKKLLSLIVAGPTGFILDTVP